MKSNINKIQTKIIVLFQFSKNNLIKILRENKSENLLKIHYTGSTFEGYFYKVNFVLSNQIKELKNSQMIPIFSKIEYNTRSINEESKNNVQDIESNFLSVQSI